MIHKITRTTLATVFLIGLLMPATQGTVQGSEPTMPQVQAHGQMYMVYYKKPSWKQSKCCGPYSYSKACNVADSLEDQGCKTSIKRAK
jgi:hypothetical protein